jgi:hypothetical protein
LGLSFTFDADAAWMIFEDFVVLGASAELEISASVL